MKIAAEAEDGSYAVLHKNQPIMYTALGAKAYAAPALFRMADGTFGLVAGDGGSNGNILLYTSEDLIDYANERQVTLPGLSSIAKLSCVYDLTEKQYLLNRYTYRVHTYTSSNLTDFSSTETPAAFAFAAVQNAPSDAVWASALDLTQAEYDKLTAKFTNPYNTSIDSVTKEVTVAVNGDARGRAGQGRGFAECHLFQRRDRNLYRPLECRRPGEGGHQQTRKRGIPSAAPSAALPTIPRRWRPSSRSGLILHCL